MIRFTKVKFTTAGSSLECFDSLPEHWMGAHTTQRKWRCIMVYDTLRNIPLLIWWLNMRFWFRSNEKISTDYAFPCQKNIGFCDIISFFFMRNSWTSGHLVISCRRVTFLRSMRAWISPHFPSCAIKLQQVLEIEVIVLKLEVLESFSGVTDSAT